MGEVVKIEKDASEQVSFEDFWLLYPRRVARKDALKAWLQIPESQHVELIVGLAAWRQVWLSRGELQYVPYPATFLRGERWTDELPASNHSSHQPAAIPESGPRTTVPEHVRSLIARLRR